MSRPPPRCPLFPKPLPTHIEGGGADGGPLNGAGPPWTYGAQRNSTAVMIHKWSTTPPTLSCLDSQMVLRGFKDSLKDRNGLEKCSRTHNSW
ncbi:hypothetical protein L1987_80922 [Smallanthus sonchifolius]|uniref:Uncharacterized protein n=1 Tax=Smallanthus sonchifolius TaxID=185202 RepID=A0ACB8YQ41_9ASTR|nr:hypothetical protein L1987_80922 [Smallanthus sonchifolius]